MNKRWLFGCIVLFIVSLLIAVYTSLGTEQSPALPPAPVPAAEPQQEKQEQPAEKAVEQPKRETVRMPFQKPQTVEEAQPEAGFSLQQKKAREILPGVSVEDKELRIQLEKENESLHLRRAGDDQVQMLWKQKF